MGFVDFLIGLVLGLASGFFLLELKPVWIGIAIAGAAAGLASRKASLGALAGAIDGFFLIPVRNLFLTLLSVLRLGLSSIIGLVLTTGMSLLSLSYLITLATYAIVSGVIGGVLGYVSSKIREKRRPSTPPRHPPYPLKRLQKPR